MAEEPDRFWLSELLTEMRRRRVFRVAVVYAAVAWLVAQLANTIFPAFGVEAWVMRALVLVALLGFPLAVVLAWAFEVSPTGVRRAPVFTDEEGMPRRQVQVAGLAVLLLLSALVGWGGWALWLAPGQAVGEGGGAGATGAAGPAATPDRPVLDPTRVAVLYFDDHTPGEEARHIAEGLTEALIHELSVVEALSVSSRTAVRPYRGGDVPLDSIVRALQVGTVVEGSVLLSGDSLRVTVQLVDGATLAHLDSRRVERSTGELFGLLDELAADVSEILRRRLGVEVRLRALRAGAPSVRAWEWMRLAGTRREDARELEELGDRQAARRALAEADSLLRLAAEDGPRWAEPWVQRGWVALDRARLGAASPSAYDAAWLDSALVLAERALTVRPEAAAALELRGTSRFYRSWDMGGSEGERAVAGAEEDLRRAVSVEPGNARAWAALGDVLRSRGRLAEAVHATRRAVERNAFLSVDMVHIIFDTGHLALEVEELEEARRLVTEGRRRFPDDPAFDELALNYLASSPQGRSDADTAWALARALRDAVGPELWTNSRMKVAAVLAQVGLPDSARAVIGTARATGATNAFTDYYEAYARLRLGEPELALDRLTRYLAERPQRRPYVAADWWFRPLRGNDRFRSLVEEPAATPVEEPTGEDAAAG